MEKKIERKRERERKRHKGRESKYTLDILPSDKVIRHK